MLAKFQTVLKRAQRGRYAVGAFNVSNLEHIQAVLAAAKKLHAPVIVNVSEKAMAYASPDGIAGMVMGLMRRHPYPVVLGLDHGRHLASVKVSLKSGFSGIMFDASTRNYAANVQVTRQAVLAAKRYGVGVEGELGQVKYPKDLQKDPTPIMTDPVQAVDYIRRTHVCALAVAVGNSHVIPNDRLDFGRLRAIRRNVTVPLVLHGSSGTATAAIRKAVGLGIAKINIDTDLRKAFTHQVRSILLHDRSMIDPREYLGQARQAMQREITKKILLFGGKGKGR